MKNTYYDLVVLGAGPAGTRAAFDAAVAGMKTAIVEAGFLGGTCLNAGCIPTKYLLGGTADLPLLDARQAPEFDLAALQGRKDQYLKEVRDSLEKQLSEAGVQLLRGRGAFIGPQEMKVRAKDAETAISFGKCIVATGSGPAGFPGLKPDGASVKAAAAALMFTTVPESLIIVGGGAIGLELGDFYRRLGARIILVEVSPRILVREEPAISAAVAAYHQQRGWSIYTGRRISSVTTVDGRAALCFKDGEVLRADNALLAMGRRPVTAGLTPENAGISLTARGWLNTDECLQCTEHIYAVGDINGRTLLANAATHQAAYAVSHAAGGTREPYPHPCIASCIHGSFEVLRVGPGLRELQSQATGELSVSQAPLSGNPIARSYGQTQGFVRVLWEGERPRSVGAVGHGVSHLMAAAALLLQSENQKKPSSSVIFSYPALDEVLESAILSPRESIQ